MSSGPAVLAVERLAKTFDGFRAVEDVSFVVGAGEVVAMIGPNGAGKTTTFNMITGQLRPDRGRVSIEGHDMTGASARAMWQRGVARTFQITQIFASMSVAENVAMALASRANDLGSLSTLMERYGDEASRQLDRTGMRSTERRISGQLSYGDLKRVELAMALVHSPRLLLMDEPTAGMAPAERQALMAEAVGIARNRGTAVLFTEHNMDVVFDHADRVVVLSAGRLIADGDPSQVRRDPIVRDVYLGHAPRG